MNICEIPTTVAACPTGAIRPDPKTKSVVINEDKCMYCGNCYNGMSGPAHCGRGKRRDIHLGGGQSFQRPNPPYVFQAGDPVPSE